MVALRALRAALRGEADGGTEGNGGTAALRAGTASRTQRTAVPLRI